MSTADNLRYTDLYVRYRTVQGYTNAVDGISLVVPGGTCLGIVGESGSGKTQLSLALIGLLPRTAIIAGSIELNGTNLLSLDAKAWRSIRGRVIATVFQDPMSSMTPHLRIETQLCEVLRYHRELRGAAARREALRMLDVVQIDRGAERLRQFPHELSGGTLQRVALAMALLGEPRILVSDEPTASLDATTRLGILKLFNEVRRMSSMTLIMISHDLRAIQSVADDLMVMYAGRIAEHGSVSSVLSDPRHPYTLGLLGGTLMAGRTRRSRLEAIAGEPTLGGVPEPGCAFRSRCGRAQAICGSERPVLRRVGAHSEAACHFAGERIG